MYRPTISTMKIEKLERSKRVSGRVLLFLDDGSILKLTEQELLEFDLHAGEEVDAKALEALKEAAGTSGAKAEAAALIGRRAMSRSDLEKKLRGRGASARDAAYAAEWLEAIGALSDRDYAAMLVRHCAQMGYGPARYREELRRHGVDRELWDEAIEQAPDTAELVERYLAERFRRNTPDERECRRATDALVRRGFSWGNIRDGLRPYQQADHFDD